MNSPIHSRVIIIGSGPAGYTAALYAARANLRPLLIAGSEPGGQLITTLDVENWPADVDGVQGPELMTRFRSHAERFGTKVIEDHIRSVSLDGRPFRLDGLAASYTCDALIIATGASAKWLGLPSEREFMGRGVSGCATCDGFFYQDEDVCIVGGGNTAVEEAIVLSNIARSVTLVHRRGALRAEPILLERLMAKVGRGSVRLKLNATLDLIEGDASGVTGVRLRDVGDGSIERLDVRGCFIAIGHAPNTGIFEGRLDMRDGYIVTRGGSEGSATMTSVVGVFAAGDVQDQIYRQAVTSAATGCMAALDARSYLEEQSHGATGPEVTSDGFEAAALFPEGC